MKKNLIFMVALSLIISSGSVFAKYDAKTQTDNGAAVTETSKQDKVDRGEKPVEVDRTEKAEKTAEDDSSADVEKPVEDESSDEVVKPHVSDRPERSERPDSTVKPERSEKPDSTAKPERSERPDSTEKPEETDEPEGTEQPDGDRDHHGNRKFSKKEFEEKRDSLKQLKKDTKEYIKDIKDLFGKCDNDAKSEILDEIAKVKKELKDESIGTFIKGKPVDYDKYDGVKPIIEDERALVPIRALTETDGAEVQWDEEEQTITITSGDVVISMQIGNITATVNGEEVELEVEPKIVNERTIVPIRFIMEALGLDVNWDDNSRTIIVE